jgi:hypothetical protein
LTSSGQIVRAATIGARENSGLQTYNLSVPGFTVANALSYPFPGSPTTNPIDALSDVILATLEPPSPAAVLSRVAPA